MFRRPIMSIGLVCMASPCLAQSATVTAMHNHPTGLVQPGETVRISFSTTWTGALQLARHVGDAVASPDIGIASNHGGEVGQGPLVYYGAPSLGSVRGVDVGSGVPWSWPNPFWTVQPVTFLSYDWTAPQEAGLVEFNWVPSPDLPDAVFYMTSMSITYSPLPTTYIGTSLVVVPAPGGAAAVVAGAVLAWARRRR